MTQTDAAHGEPDTQQPAVDKPLAPRRTIFALAAAQYGLFVGLMAPAMLSMQLKAQELAPDNPAALVGAVLPFGALGAFLANPIAGALSDRTRTRWGRRRPWLISGTLLFVLGLTFTAFAADQLQLTLAWIFTQIAANATLAALIASFADNVPAVQRGKASSGLALAQNLAILTGTYLAVYLAGNLPLLFITPGILAILFIGIYCVVAKDEVPTERLPKFGLLTLFRSFWTNPFKFPDFGFAWWSRFLIYFSSTMFISFRLLYMQDHLGLEVDEATAAVATGVLIYTVCLMFSAALSGWLSDRLGRRKIFVAGAAVGFGIGMIMLAFADSVGGFYLAEVVLGFAYGIYSAVDTALIIDVLPNPAAPGKDMGVVNIASAAPQSLAPAFAVLLLGIGSASNENYVALLWGAGIIAAIGALAIIPIRKVR